MNRNLNRTRSLAGILLVGLLIPAGCGDPQSGTIKKPAEAATLDPGRPFGNAEPAPKRKAKESEGSDFVPKNPKLAK